MTLQERVARAIAKRLGSTLDAMRPTVHTKYMRMAEAAIEATGVVELRSAIEDAIDWLKSAPLESGWCCCGDKVEAHNIGSGHSPVDELGYSAMRLQERLQFTLTQLAKGSE